MLSLTSLVERSRGGLVTIVCGVAIAAAGAGLIVLSQQVGGSDEPPKARTFAAPARSPFLALDVKSREGAQLTLIEQKGETAVQRDLALTDTMKVERLSPIAPADVKAGDWLTLIGIPNEVKSFSIHIVVVLPGSAGDSADGALRSAGGFLGHEASRNPNDRPVLGGTVEGVQETPCPSPTTVPGGESGQRGPASGCGDIRLKVPTGVAVVHIEPGARFYRLETVTESAVKEGDRIAGIFTNGPPRALLVLPNEGG